MNPTQVKAEKIYILGGGAVGLALAACLADAGRNVLLVRTSTAEVEEEWLAVAVTNGTDVVLKASVPVVPLTQLHELNGLVVVTAKSYANPAIAAALAARTINAHLVVMQNGLGVEESFLTLPFTSICRCVLYMTGEKLSENKVLFRPIASSPIGIVQGTAQRLEETVATLTTSAFPFHVENDIARQVWGKTIINAVFNSLCPLLEADNGIFIRDATAAALAHEIVRECIALAAAQGIHLTETELMDRIMAISRGSDGVLISTLQDIRQGRETEMEALNLALARIASGMNPQMDLCRTEMLGRMVLAKGKASRGQ